MGDIDKHRDDLFAEMDLTAIENLIQQVDVMVGVGEISSFPEEIAVTSETAPGESAAEAEEEPVLKELDEFEALAPAVQFFRRVVLVLPSRRGIDASLPVLRKCSEKNAELMAEAADDPSLLPGFLGITVFPGQVFARVVTWDKEGQDVGDQELQGAEGTEPKAAIQWVDEEIVAGAHVVLDGNDYRAERYGYLDLTAGRFAVLSPFFVSRDRLQVHWGIFSREAQNVTPVMLQVWLDEIGVKPAMLDVDKVERLQRALTRGEHQRGVFLIAVGEKPVAGIDARVELLVSMERAGGIERPDGSVDFREVRHLPNVEKGQLLAHRIAAIPGTPGKDVTGAEIPVEGGRDVPLEIDKSVRRVKGADVDLYYAARSGAMRYAHGVLSVVNTHSLDQGVNYETGNVNFAGDVFVKGAVAEGFSVRAEGDITITDTVSDGAEIVSVNGSVTVGCGVVGRRAKILARKAVRVQFVHDATIRCDGDIVVGNYLYNAVLYAGGTLEIRKGEGSRGGSILGGRIVAVNGMEMWSAGSPSWVATELAVGFDPEATVKRERVEEAITKTSRHLYRILDVFRLSRLEPERIRAMVAQAVGSRRKFLEQQARLLGQLAKSYKALLDMRQALREGVTDREEPMPRIKVQGTAYPGVVVRIGRQSLRLEREYDATVFKQGERTIEAV